MNVINDFDELLMYFGDDYRISENIIIHQPTIGEIVLWGEKKYFSMITTLCSIPSDMKSFLFDNGIDYETISDFDFFLFMYKGFSKSETSIIFGDLELEKFEPCKLKDEIVLFWKEKDITIDESIYQKMINYIRQMHNIVPKIEKAANAYTKNFLIEEDRKKYSEIKNTDFTSVMKPLISSMLNSSGFKYKKNELREVGIVEFMDSVKRISVIMSTDALLKGMYSGMIDTSKINKNEFNWMRELNDNSPSRGEGIAVSK